MPPTGVPQVLCFGRYALEIGRGCLRLAEGDEMRLAPKPFDLLAVLARNAGQTMSKDALLEAVWPGVNVTEDSLFQAVREARRAIGDEAGLVLRSVPKRGYMLDAAVTGLETAVTTTGLSASPLAPPSDRPSLVVLPFQNMSGDPEQDYFADGVVEDITTALSGTQSLLVIARSSAFTYKGRTMDVRDIGRELGVRYVLQGSIRRSRDQVRIGVQIVEAESREQLWADRLDGDWIDVFARQDRIVEAVAGAIEPNLRVAEITRARRKTSGSLDAYDLYLRALVLTDSFTPQSVTDILELCERAIAIDPQFTRAYELGTRAHIQTISHGSFGASENEQKVALSWAERGLVSDHQDALMLAQAGHAVAYFAKQLDRGIAYVDEAVNTSPFLVVPLLKSGIMRRRTGQTALAIEHLNRAHRLSPRDPRRYAIFAALSTAYLMEGDAVAARGWATRAVQQNDKYLPSWRALAAAAGQLGIVAEGRAAVQRILCIAPGIRFRDSETR